MSARIAEALDCIRTEFPNVEVQYVNGLAFVSIPDAEIEVTNTVMEFLGRNGIPCGAVGLPDFVEERMAS